jgi:acetyl esterase
VYVERFHRYTFGDLGGGVGRLSSDPLFTSNLAGLPATYVITCEHEPLRDQGEAYAKRMADAGVPTVLRREPGMAHNFMLWDMISPACAAASDRVAADVTNALRFPRRP